MPASISQATLQDASSSSLPCTLSAHIHPQKFEDEMTKDVWFYYEGPGAKVAVDKIASLLQSIDGDVRWEAASSLGKRRLTALRAPIK